MKSKLTLLDCTFRDGGYYNNWNFDPVLIQKYLRAMAGSGVDIVELGFRFRKNQGFRGGCAFTTDAFLSQLNIPENLDVAVMVNGSDLFNADDPKAAVAELFPVQAHQSPVDMVRVACHFRELAVIEPGLRKLVTDGYRLGINLMQISDRTEDEIAEFATLAERVGVEVLYFADSLGSLTPADTTRIVETFKRYWPGDIGIHTHDNLGLALQNTLSALDVGASWADATVTGMGRGPGNARTEELAIELAERRNSTVALLPLVELINQYFAGMKEKYGWGTNPFYYLSGKYGIHPTFVQHMISDNRFSAADILAVLEHLRGEGGKSFSLDRLSGARAFYHGEPGGSWSPKEAFDNSDILLLGTGPGVARHKDALEAFASANPALKVLALNTQDALEPELIHYRIACHPLRMLADQDKLNIFPQPLITPVSSLPDTLKGGLRSEMLLDFGLSVAADQFEVKDKYCVLPTALVLAYALAALKASRPSRIFLAGFDGYPAGDPRNQETQDILDMFLASDPDLPIASITPCGYDIPEKISVYGLT